MAGRELFNQTLIESPNQPDDNDRVAFGTPSSATGKNILWGYFKTLIQSIASVFNWIDFVPQSSAPTEQKGRIYYDELTESYEAFEWITGVAPMSLGRTLRSRIKTPVGTPLSKGNIVKITGLDGFTPIVSKATADELIDARSTIGMVLSDIVADTEANSYGLIAVYDVVLGVNTAGMSVDDLVYLSDTTPGGFTNVAPSPPNYTLPVGFVSVVDAVNGAIGVRFGGFNGNDTSTNSQGIINGIITQTPNVDVSVSGGIIYADVTNEQEPTKNLPFILDGMRYLMDTTTNTGPGGAARVVVPPGADAETLQESIIYLYLNGGVPAIGIATTPPSIPYARVCNLMVFNAARTLADGKPDGYRRYNDAINLTNGVNDGSIGLIRDILASIREKLGANWLDGQDGTPTVNNTNIKLALSAGVARQFRQQNTPSFDGNLYQIYNNTSNIVTYQSSTNLTDITQDANGNSLLANNTFYTIRIFYQLNSNGVGNNVIATRPLGFYATAEQAQSDPLNYAVNMGDPIKEELVYPLYDLIIGRTGAGGATISLIELRDKRSKLAQGGGGGGAQGASIDEKLRVSAADTTTDYLSAKLTEGANITLTIENPGGNETLRIDSAGSTANNGLNKSLNNIQLGGDLIEDTILGITSNNLALESNNTIDYGTGFNAQTEQVLRLSSGSIALSGWFTSYSGSSRNYIALISQYGQLLTSFNPGTGFNNLTFCLAELDNGSFLVGGNFTSYNGTSANRIIALKQDGTIDTSFNIGTGFDGGVFAMARQSDGKIIVGGSFLNYNGSSASTHMVRLNADGTIDGTYTPSGMTGSGSVTEIEILPDDRVIISGTESGTSTDRIKLLNTSGIADATFGTRLVETSKQIETIHYRSGIIYIGGNFTSYDGTSTAQICAINLDGTINTSFNASGNSFTGTSIQINSIKSFGSELIVAGNFTGYAGESQNLLIKIDLTGEFVNMPLLTTGFSGSDIYSMLLISNFIFTSGVYSSYNGVSFPNISTITFQGELLEGDQDFLVKFNSSVPFELVTGGSIKAQISQDGTGVFQNLVISGTLTVPILIQTETLQVSDNLIETRYDSTVGLGVGEYTGIQANLYDGVNDGQLVFDKDGWARVGDVGSLVKIAAIEESPTDKGVSFWNNTTLRLETSSNLIFDGSNLGINKTPSLGTLDVAGTGYFSSTVTATNNYILNGNAGSNRGLQYKSSDSLRWQLYANATSETGSNAGSDFSIARYSDTAGFLGVALGINRATGAATFSSTVTATDFTASSLPVYANNAAALSGGLTAGKFYKTAATGDAQVMIVNAT